MLGLSLERAEAVRSALSSLGRLDVVNILSPLQRQELLAKGLGYSHCDMATDVTEQKFSEAVQAVDAIELARLLSSLQCCAIIQRAKEMCGAVDGALSLSMGDDELGSPDSWVSLDAPQSHGVTNPSDDLLGVSIATCIQSHMLTFDANQLDDGSKAQQAPDEKRDSEVEASAEYSITHAAVNPELPRARYSSYKNMPSWEDMAERVYFRRTPAVPASLRRQRARASSQRSSPGHKGAWVPAGPNDIHRVNTSSSTALGYISHQSRPNPGKVAEPSCLISRQISSHRSQPSLSHPDIVRRIFSKSPERLASNKQNGQGMESGGECKRRGYGRQPTDRVFENAAEEDEQCRQDNNTCQDDERNLPSKLLEAQYRRLAGAGDVALFGSPSLEVRLLHDPGVARFSSNPAE